MDPVLLGLARNPALPRALVAPLTALAAADPDDELAARLAGRPDLDGAQVAALAAQVPASLVPLVRAGRLTADDVDPAARPDAAPELLDEGRGTPAWARRFAADPDRAHREALAACPGLPPDVVDVLAGDPDVRVVAELALWGAPGMAARLAAHPSAQVRRAVACDEAAPPDVLTALVTGEGMPPVRRCQVCDQEEVPFAHDPSCPRADCELPAGASCDGTHASAVHDVVLAALLNPATPPEGVPALAADPSSLLRAAVAARPGLPRDVYARLAEDPAPGVRESLAGNPSIEAGVFRTLAGDRYDEVRRALAHHPRVPWDVLARLAASTRVGAVLLPRVAAASPAEVRDLAGSARPELRVLVARRRDLPAPVRDALAGDADAKVAGAVAGHPGLPESLLRMLTRRHGDRVAAAVASRPDVPAELLEELALREPPVRKALRATARQPHAPGPALLVCLRDARARQDAAGHPGLPPSVVTGLLDDPDEAVAEKAAANPSLPRPVMAARVLG
ncbi:hypothetical protein [Streptomyces sp. NPDC059783]|uniref:hypothetical protein n=1 Tax=Streptomyces sp. NPDC059783 TaxID=3346944 RepID=UPI003651AFE2